MAPRAARILVPPAVLALVSLTAFGQADEAPVTMRPPAMAKLDGLVGQWRGTSSSHVQGEPATNSPLKGTFQWILRDYHLQGVLQYTVDGRSYEATMIWSYDRSSNLYSLYWIHNFSSDATVYRGQFRNGVFALTSRDREGGQEIISVLRLQIESAGGWKIDLATGPDGDVRSTSTLTAARIK
jgi:hypothetical protein